MPPGKINLTNGGGSDTASVYKTTADAAAVKAYYTDALKAKGWVDAMDSPQVTATTQTIASKLGTDMQVSGAYFTLPDAAGKISYVYVFTGTPSGSLLSGVGRLSDSDRVITVLSGSAS